MIEPTHPDISIKAQCRLLKVSRSAVYYQSRKDLSGDLELMRLIDEQYLKTPHFGSRSMCTYLRRKGYTINRKRVRRLMRTMGLEAVYPRPRTSQPGEGHKVYPYLLKELNINRPNQVWGTDITYIPLERGFMYLVAIMDWHSRRVLAWRLSNTMDADFCIDALEEAITNYGKPDIFNSDQGSQFTSEAFTNVLKLNSIQISMDGKGCYRDNIFVERLWRTVKYECVYLNAFNDGKHLRQELKRYFEWYNAERPHQRLSDNTPDEVYFKQAA